EELHGLGRHDRGNRMLVDELRMCVAAQQYREIIEPGDDALQLHAVHQEYGDRHLALPNVIQENVLNVLRFFRSHWLPLFLKCSRGPGLLGPEAGWRGRWSRDNPYRA